MHGAKPSAFSVILEKTIKNELEKRIALAWEP